MPPLVLFILRHALVGSVVGWLFAAALWYWDVGGIGTLMARSDVGLLAFAVMGFALSLTFGGASVATAVLAMADYGGADGEPPLWRKAAIGSSALARAGKPEGTTAAS